MKMFVNKRNKMKAHNGLLTPEAEQILNKNRFDSVGTCRCFGDGMQYEVDCLGKTYVVDLGMKSYGCNMWDLTGIPCAHAICCIVKNRFDVHDYVDPYYHKETFLKVYECNVNPMPGEDQWKKTDQPPLDPPKLVVQPGRPKKMRKKEPDEDKDKKVPRAKFGKNKCGNCGEEGHIRRTCKNPPKPAEPPREAIRKGRPPKENTMAIQPQKRKYTKRKVS